MLMLIKKLLVCREGKGLHVTYKYVSGDILNWLLCQPLQNRKDDWVCPNFVDFRLNKIIPTVFYLIGIHVPTPIR